MNREWGKTRRLSLRAIRVLSRIGLTSALTVGCLLVAQLPAEGLKTVTVQAVSEIRPAEPAADEPEMVRASLTEEAKSIGAAISRSPDVIQVQGIESPSDVSADEAIPAHLEQPERAPLQPNSLRASNIEADSAADAPMVMAELRDTEPTQVASRSTKPYQRANVAPRRLATTPTAPASRSQGRGLLQRFFQKPARPAAKPIPAPRPGQEQSSDVVNAIFSRSNVAATRSPSLAEAKGTPRPAGVRFKLTDQSSIARPATLAAQSARSRSNAGASGTGSSRRAAATKRALTANSTKPFAKAKDSAPTPTTAVMDSKSRSVVRTEKAKRDSANGRQPPADVMVARPSTAAPRPATFFGPAAQLQEVARHYHSRAARDHLKGNWAVNSHSGPLPPYRMLNYQNRTKEGNRSATPPK